MANFSGKKKAGRQASSGGLGDLSLHNPKFQKLLLALHSTTEPKAFLKAAEQLIHAAIPCDVVYTLLHYSLDRGKSSVAWGSDGTVFTNEHVRGSLDGNPITWVLDTKPGVKAHCLRDCYASAGQMEDDAFFHRYIRGIGVHHATVIPMWRESMDGADMVIGPHRALGRGEFTRDELAIMEALHPHIDIAYQRVNRLQTETGALLGLGQCIEPLPLATVLVNWDLQPIYFNESAQDAVASWCGANLHLKEPRRGLEVPGELLAAIKTMRETWTTKLRDGAGTATLGDHVVEHPLRPEWRAHISMTTLGSPHFGKPSFVVRLESSSPGRSEKLATFARLSPRERKLVQRVCNGESNQEIADAIGRSVNTVKSELYTIFRKLGVPSRARLISILR